MTRFTLLLATSIATTGTAWAQALAVSGICPGPMTITGTDFDPGERLALISAAGPGAVSLPGGPCAGTMTGLSPAGLALRTVGFADGSGRYSLFPTIPPSACGAYLQMASLDRCGVMTSPVGFSEGGGFSDACFDCRVAEAAPRHCLSPDVVWSSFLLC